MQSITAVLKSIIAFVKALYALPKKAITLVNQDWKKLGKYVYDAFAGILESFLKVAQKIEDGQITSAHLEDSVCDSDEQLRYAPTDFVCQPSSLK